VDGVVGPHTVAAINSVSNTRRLFEAIAQARRQAIADLIARDPSQARFRTGWDRWMTEIESVGLIWLGKKKVGLGTSTP
jgi:lysozyme family protein